MPKTAVDEIKDRMSSSGDKKYYDAQSKVSGIQADQLRILDTDSKRLVAMGKTYEQRMFSLAMGQYEMLRFIGNRSKELVTAMGGESTRDYNIEYEQGAIGKLIDGLKNILS